MRARQTGRLATQPALTIAVVLLSSAGGKLAVLLQRQTGAGARDRWSLPRDIERSGETIERAARRIAKGALGGDPSWLEQLATFNNHRQKPTQGTVTVAYLGLVPGGAERPMGSHRGWFSLADMPTLTLPEGEFVAASLKAARERMDHAPIGFRLLPTTFTLSELQAVYEVLLGRKLHKASFRRALQAAWLVVPLEEWRTEGRGRPAQLYRYAPRRRRISRRSVRFDRLV